MTVTPRHQSRVDVTGVQNEELELSNRMDSCISFEGQMAIISCSVRLSSRIRFCIRSFFLFFFLKKKKKQVGRTNVLSCFVFFLFFSHLTDFGSGLTRSHQPLLESEETVSWTFDTVKVENEKKKKKKTCHVIFPSFSVYVAAALLPIPPTFTRLLFFRFFNFPRVETKNKKIPPFIWCRPIPSFYKKTKKE